MKKLIVSFTIIIATISAHAQERFIGNTRHYIDSFFSKYSEPVMTNDTSVIVKAKMGASAWQYFKFNEEHICVLAAKEVQFFNEFTDLEKKLKAKKYKKTGEMEYDFVVRKAKGAVYTNGKETYVLMYDAINPVMANSTRAVIYYKTK